jgi:sec-independent protein translocase protein TatA
MWAVALIVIVLILFGVGRLPSAGGSVGRGLKEFRQGLRNDEPVPQGRPESSKKD